VKPQLGLSSDPIVLSFGLLGPGKGYETVIEAMPEVVKAVPNARYVVLGATHPDLLRHEGEKYRRSLEARALELGVADHMLFVDRFVSPRELGTWLGAADIFVTPYPNLDQIVSGTLSYAMGAGKAIVSTPYAYASELLADGRGRLVEPSSHTALADAFIELLRANGLVRDSGGKPLAGAAVRVTSPSLIGGEKSVTTAENGTYRMAGLPPGTYSSPSTLLISTPVTLDAGGDANAVVMYFSQTPHTGPVPSAESLQVLDEYFAWRRTPEGEAWAK